MDRTFWHKQTAQQPLFPDLQWSRPENRARAGKLLIIGGNAQGFSAPAEAFAAANKTGAGTVRVLLPDALQKSVGRVFTDGEYAPSTPSGSFAQTAIGELLPMTHWSDAVFFPGQLGRNSETAIMLESFLSKYSGQVTLTCDAIEYVTTQPNLIRERPNSLLVLSFSQLQKLLMGLKLPLAVTSDMDIFRLVDVLHELTTSHPFALITRHLDKLFVAVNGEVSSTPAPTDKIWRLQTASAASVWWLQNPGQSFAALTTSLVAD